MGKMIITAQVKTTVNPSYADRRYSSINRLMRFLVTNCVKSIFYHLPFVNDRKATHFYICSLIEVQPSWTDDENKDNSDKKQVSNLDKKHANCYFINFILKETSNLVTGGG